MSTDLKQGANLAGGILASGQIQTGQTLNFTGSPTGGTFTVTVTTSAGAVTTAAQTYSASYAAATLQSVLQALSNVGSGNLLVAGSNGGPFTITAPTGFVCTLAVTPSLTGGTSPSASFAGVAATLYTVPTAAASAAVVKTAVLTSTAASAVAVTGYVVPKGSSVDSTRICGLNAYSLAAADSTHWTEVQSGIYDSDTNNGARLVVTLGSGAVNAVNYLITGAVNS